MLQIKRKNFLLFFKLFISLLLTNFDFFAKIEVMEKCLFVYNPQSGKCKIKNKEDYIVNKLKEKFEVTVAHSQYAGHISEIILEKGGNFDVIVGAGGDGTLNEIINAVMRLDKKPILGYIPSGTVNDVAHSLYIPKNVKKAVDNILNGQVFYHDIMKINERYGIYVCCAGLFTEASYATNQNIKKKMGKVAYFFHGAKGLFNTKALKIKLKNGESELEGKFAIILLNNSRYTAGMKINKRAVLNDGLIDVILVDNKRDKVSLASAARVAGMFLRGIEHTSAKKHYHHILAQQLEVELDSETIINLDGEKISAGSFKAQVIKEGIGIIVPRKDKLTKVVKFLSD